MWFDNVIVEIKGCIFFASQCNFQNQTGWQYSDGDPLTGESNTRGYEKITIFNQYLALSRR